MEYIGYILLAIVVLFWLIAIMAGMIAIFPVGILGFFAIGGIGFLLAQVIKDRLINKEDDYYTKNVEK